MTCRSERSQGLIRYRGRSQVRTTFHTIRCAQTPAIPNNDRRERM